MVLRFFTVNFPVKNLQLVCQQKTVNIIIYSALICISWQNAAVVKRGYTMSII
jgi:hypothetical protein